jgi:hypothetical protein
MSTPACQGKTPVGGRVERKPLRDDRQLGRVGQVGWEGRIWQVKQGRMGKEEKKCQAVRADGKA